MKRKAIAFGVLVLVVVAFSSQLPGRWSEIRAGMKREEVYAKLGRPAADYEATKGAVVWRRNLIIGRWEFDVAFRADKTVGSLGWRWRWAL